MHALKVRREIPGHLTDRLQEALWREILHLVNDGVATTGELDESIVYGPGLRWAAMGTNQIYHLAGGEAGMRHMLAQFGPCLKWPWTKLEAPELTESLIDKMVEGTSATAAGRSIRELERLRDDYLVAIQQVLRQFDIGAGGTLRALETRLYEDAARHAAPAAADPAQPLRLLESAVRAEWIDYNGHLTDSRYLQLFGDAADALWRRAGVDEAYRATGRALFTVASHVDYLAEVGQADSVYVTTRVLDVDAKKLRVFHWLYRGDGTLAATAEQMFVHVDTRAKKSAPMAPEVLAKFERIQQAQAGEPRPAAAGRGIGAGR
jgi:carnitine 3-dehydrogenase